MARNLTVQLDDEVIRQAKTLAARRGTSVSALVAAQIESMTAAELRYRRARDSALRVLEETRAERDRLDHEDVPGAEERRWSREALYDERLGRYGS